MSLGIARALAKADSSALDVLKENKTEIEQINGAVVREARRLEIPTPVNETLVGLVKTLEESYGKRIHG